MTTYLIDTPLLDYQSPIIRDLIAGRGWEMLSSKCEKISAIHSFVRDEILFTFPKATDIPASQVLASQSGNSMAKTTLFMALLRGVGIHCRMEPALVHRSFFSGIVAKRMMWLVPQYLCHSSVGIRYSNRWINVGGYSIDRSFVERLKAEYPQYTGSFYSFGLATLNFRNPYSVWDGTQTRNCEHMVSTPIDTYTDPDSFYETVPKAAILCGGIRGMIIRNHGNKRIAAIREGAFFK